MEQDKLPSLKKQQLLEELRGRVELEQLALEISAHLVGLPAARIGQGIRDSLERLAAFADANRAAVFTVSRDSTRITNTHEWCADPSDSQIAQLQNIPFATFGYHERQLRALEVMRIGRPDDYPREAAGERAWIAEHGFRSLVFVPMTREGALSGALGFYGEVGVERVWPDRFVRLLELLANVIGNAVLRQRSEQALVRARSLLSAAQRIAGLGSWEWRAAEDDLSWSPQMYTIFEIAPAEALSHARIRDLVVASEREAFDAALEAAARGEPTTFEYSVRTGGGVTKTLREIVEPDFDADGALVGLWGTVQDVTAQREAEQARLALETKVLHAQKLESLGLLAGGIAHDFNNLLVGILAHADVARRGMAPTAPVREDLTAIIAAARRAADLAGQMLAYSGKGKMVVTRVRLPSLVEEMLQLLRTSISKKTSLHCDFGEGTPAVDVDVTQMRQVIMNLVINASEALGEGSGLVTVRTSLRRCSANHLFGSDGGGHDEEGPYACLEVSDTGCGMDPEAMSRIFDPFFSTKATGRGLGLAAVTGIVRGHGGAIKVRSEPGKGTTFEVLLPAAVGPAAEATAPPNAAEPAGEGQAAGPAGNGRHVLLVDDDATVRKAVVRTLRALGYRVSVAEDGGEAVERYRAEGERFDVVLLDLTMPRMDGDECLRAIREIDPEARVILSSGYSEQKLCVRFAGRGLAGFIQKPYDVAQIRQALQECFADEPHDDGAA